ncbi:MAG: hypothetical protein II589_04905 [Clostridia bacterium]|nr:hypothetical protein [Clostridia bacterium]
MKISKLFRRIVASVLVLSLSFTCLPLSSVAVVMPQGGLYDMPELIPSVGGWPHFSPGNGGQYNYNNYNNYNDKNRYSDNRVYPKETYLVPAPPPVKPKPRDPNSFSTKVQEEVAKGVLPDLVKAFITEKLKDVGRQIVSDRIKYLKKCIEGLGKSNLPKKVLDSCKANLEKMIKSTKDGVKKFAKGTGKVFSKILKGIFLFKGIYDFIKNPYTGYKSPFLEFCAITIKSFNAFVSPFVPWLALPLTALEVIFTCTEVVDFFNKYVPFLPHDIPFYINDYIQQWVIDKLFNGDQRDYIKNNEENYKKILLENLKKKQKGASPTANGIGVYKPNIYLYPTENTDVSVQFGIPDLLTVTDPPYENGWNVTASPNGQLKSGDTEYEYLFYESVTYPDYYELEEGFVIPTENRREVFAEILRKYGLNEKEINDFCEFWCEKLDSNKVYAMYPQGTEIIDKSMPMTVEPQFDSRMRLWFAFVENDVPKAEPKPQGFVRSGNTMVEWGGFILNK